MKTILILLLMAAPATAAGWDLDNLTLTQRAQLITMRDRWNNGFRGTPRCTTKCGPGVRHQWYDGKVKDAKQAGRRRVAPSYYTGGPLMIVNPYVNPPKEGRERETWLLLHP